MFLTHIESFSEAFDFKNSLKTDNFAFFSTHRAKSSFCFKITSYYDDSFDILQLVRRMFKIFLLTSRATLRQPFRYPQYILWSHRKFLEGSEVTEVQFFIKKTAFWHTLRFQKSPSISHFFQSFSRFVQYISIGVFWTLLRFIAVKN